MVGEGAWWLGTGDRRASVSLVVVVVRRRRILASAHAFSLTMAGMTISIPILVASFLCLKEDDPARGALVCTVLVHAGIVTLVQTTFGIR